MDKNSYALGMSIAHNMLQSGVKEVAFDDFVAGLKATLTRQEPAISYKEAGDILDKYFQELQEKQAAEQAEISEVMKREGEEFLAANAKKEGVIVLPSGLQYKVIKEGEGRMPELTDKVKCHYEGTFVDGEKFDSSYDRKQPAVFGVNQVIPGWTEALQLMSEGSVWELYIPYELAYGERNTGSIKPYSALIFTVELVGIDNGEKKAEEKKEEPQKTIKKVNTTKKKVMPKRK